MFDEGSIEGSSNLDGEIVGRSLPQLIAEIADKRAAFRRRVADAAARTPALPAVRGLFVGTATDTIIVREVCHGPRGRPGTPVIARELAQPPRFAVMNASSGALAKAVSVDAALVDHLQALNDARLPDDAGSALGRLTDAATFSSWANSSFTRRSTPGYSLATALAGLRAVGPATNTVEQLQAVDRRL